MYVDPVIELGSARSRRVDLLRLVLDGSHLAADRTEEKVLRDDDRSLIATCDRALPDVPLRSIISRVELRGLTSVTASRAL